MNLHQAIQICVQVKAASQKTHHRHDNIIEYNIHSSLQRTNDVWKGRGLNAAMWTYRSVILW